MSNNKRPKDRLSQLADEVREQIDFRNSEMSSNIQQKLQEIDHIAEQESNSLVRTFAYLTFGGLFLLAFVYALTFQPLREFETIIAMVGVGITACIVISYLNGSNKTKSQ